MDKILHVLGLDSRKGRAVILAVLAALTGYYQGAVTGEQALYAIVAAVAAQVLGIAIEDAGAKSAK